MATVTSCELSSCGVSLCAPISIKVAPVNHVSWPAVHYGKPFRGKFSLVHVH